MYTGGVLRDDGMVILTEKIIAYRVTKDSRFYGRLVSV
jgi:hypothetical protein